jgi:hypothetical protein
VRVVHDESLVFTNNFVALLLCLLLNIHISTTIINFLARSIKGKVIFHWDNFIVAGKFDLNLGLYIFENLYVYVLYMVKQHYY